MSKVENRKQKAEIGRGADAARRRDFVMRRRHGFSLIELMVTIGILMVLVAMMMGGIKAAKGKAKRTRARNEVAQIATAWTAYQTEYRRFPDAGPGNSYTISEMDEAAIQILRGSSTNAAYQAKNPRKIRFMDFHHLVTEFLDPWDNPYEVSLDEADYDGRINVPHESSALQYSAVAWSNGKDGQAGTADDICSWKER